MRLDTRSYALIILPFSHDCEHARQAEDEHCQHANQCQHHHVLLALLCSDYNTTVLSVNAYRTANLPF